MNLINSELLHHLTYCHLLKWHLETKGYKVIRIIHCFPNLTDWRASELADSRLLSSVTSFSSSRFVTSVISRSWRGWLVFFGERLGLDGPREDSIYMLCLPLEYGNPGGGCRRIQSEKWRMVLWGGMSHEETLKFRNQSHISLLKAWWCGILIFHCLC